MNNSTFSILGGGIGGLTAALALKKNNFHTTILEKNWNRSLHEEGAGIQLTPNATGILKKLNVLSDITPFACEPEKICLVDAKTHCTLAEIPLKEYIQKKFKTPYITIHRKDLITALHKKAEKAKISLHNFDCTKASSDTKKTPSTILTSSNTQQLEVPHLIAADGVHSTIRSCIYKEQAKFSQYVAQRALIDANETDDIKTKKNIIVYLNKDQHVVTYPIQQHKLINLVIISKQKTWNYDDWTVEESTSIIQKLLNKHPIALQKLLTKLPKVINRWAIFQLPLQSNMSKEALTLIGDAYHTPLPFLAQGAAMAIEDAYSLATAISQKGKSDSMQSYLQNHYENQRYRRRLRVEKATQRQASILHNSNPILQHLRNTGLRIAHRIHPSSLQKPLHWLYNFNHGI